MPWLNIRSSEIGQYIDAARLGDVLAVCPCPVEAAGTDSAQVSFWAGQRGINPPPDNFVLLDATLDNHALLDRLHKHFRQHLIPSGYRISDAIRYADIYVICTDGELKRTVETFFDNVTRKVTIIDPNSATQINDLLTNKLV